MLAGDEVVISKSGKKTYGLDRFFSSLASKPILGLSFFTLSLVSVEQRHSFPIHIEQVIKSDIEKSSPSPTKEIKPQEKRRRGRPKGSKNKNKTQVILTSELLRIQKMIKSLFKLLAKFIPLTYLVLDGHFGNNNALQMARQVNLHIISKLRYDSALYIPYQHPDPNSCSRRKYGDKIDYNNIPNKYLCKSTIDEDVQTDVYQATLLLTVLAISIVYRGCGIPIAWKIVEATKPGSWKPHWEELFRHLDKTVPADWFVIVTTDRGLYAE